MKNRSELCFFLIVYRAPTNSYLLLHFSDPSKKMLGKFLHMNSPVKTLTNLKLDWF